MRCAHKLTCGRELHLRCVRLKISYFSSEYLCETNFAVYVCAEINGLVTKGSVYASSTEYFKIAYETTISLSYHPIPKPIVGKTFFTNYQGWYQQYKYTADLFIISSRFVNEPSNQFCPLCCLQSRRQKSSDGQKQ